MVRTAEENGVVTVSLARAEKRNACTPAMLADLEAAIRGVRGRVLVLTGDGDVFCSGFDLTLCKDDDRVLGQLLEGLSACVRALRAMDIPVVVSAHGAAIAGGCALLGGCDVVVTNSDAKLGYPVLPLGISPAVSAPTLAGLTGQGHARALLLGARVISGAEALRMGLAHACEPTVEACRARAAVFAAALAAKPPHALAATKAWLRELDPATDAQVIAALGASMSVVNSDEQRLLLPAVWARG